ncbi:MAG: hypothetical protein JWP78_1232 [Mucilaginibacter sp.]|nr:hypothetical protein [Mucilaginibacter sp.]
MKKVLLIFCLLFAAVEGFSQQFSQYNTGTLYDSFENPSQQSFVPDTSKMYAFNFLIPHLNANFSLTGNAQSSLVNRAFGAKYNNAALQIGAGKYNNAIANANAYAIMFKTFVSLDGDEEVGIFAETRAEGRGAFTDESLALFDGTASFPNNIYDNVLNDHYYYQVYNSIGLSYREKLSEQFAVGFKFGFLMGTDYSKLNIYESHLSFNKTNDAAIISLRGKYYMSQGPGKLDLRSFLPIIRSPGAQISIGTSYKTEDKITFQANIKDLGFIKWYGNSSISSFNSTATVNGLSTTKREDSLYNLTRTIVNSSPKYGSFTSYTDGRFELSATKSYWVDANSSIKYSPTLIASKELLYNGFTGAMVNHFQYQNYHASLTASYDNQSLFNLGLQFMYKSYNGEFYFGSERLVQTMGLASAIHNSASYTNGSFTGADFFIGFSLKFGPVIEHPLNASIIPIGQKGFLGRLWNRLFKTYQ